MSKMTSSEAIKHIMGLSNGETYSSIASFVTKKNSLGVKVQPIQILNYYKNKRVMSEKVSEAFLEVYGIAISDSYKSKGRPSVC